MPLTLEQLEEIQADALADDVPIDLPRMRLWDRDKAVTFFEGGGVLPPSPLLVALYSAGLTPSQGRSLLGRVLAAARAAGVEDSLVLDHHTSHPACKTFDEYIAALAAQVEEAAGSARPVVLLAHSHGAVAAYGLARALGPRVRKLLVVARRPPHGPQSLLLQEVWGVCSAGEFVALPGPAILSGLVAAYRSSSLAPHARSPEAAWPPPVTETVGLARELYGSPIALCAEADIVAALGSMEPPSPPPLALPIVALAAAGEAPAGETGAKMRGWASLTRGRFALHTVANADHMGVILNKEAHRMLVEEVLEES